MSGLGLISHDSAVMILKNLSSESTGTLKLNATTYATLTEKEIAIGADKGWIVLTE